MTNNNSADLKGLKVEFHIIQSFPVTCLNRDDVGAPKSAIIGGVNRARVSSQCWKRQIRLSMHDLGASMGIRTKKIGTLISEECIKLGSPKEKAEACALAAIEILGKDGKNANQLDTLLFITPNEVTQIAEFAKKCDYSLDKKQEKELFKLLSSNSAQDCGDVALFGRMVAKAADANINAAASFSHAISTHKVANDIDFFTAVDDMKDDEESGSAHMGSLEFNSATYYRYVSVDLFQLFENLMRDIDATTRAMEFFTKALYLAVPAARQTTQSGYSTWDYAKVFIRRGQNLQASFETPVRAEREGGYSKPSIEALNTFLKQKQEQSGSLFGKVDEFEIGNDKKTSIDDVINFIKKYIQG